MPIQIDLPHTFKGHDKIVIDDDMPEKRAELAATITDVLFRGHMVVLQRDDKTSLRVRGYDAETNSWIVDDTDAAAGNGRKKRAKKSIPAGGTTATTIPAQAGG